MLGCLFWYPTIIFEINWREIQKKFFFLSSTVLLPPFDSQWSKSSSPHSTWRTPIDLRTFSKMYLNQKISFHVLKWWLFEHYTVLHSKQKPIIKQTCFRNIDHNVDWISIGKGQWPQLPFHSISEEWKTKRIVESSIRSQQCRHQSWILKRNIRPIIKLERLGELVLVNTAKLPLWYHQITSKHNHSSSFFGGDSTVLLWQQ